MAYTTKNINSPEVSNFQAVGREAYDKPLNEARNTRHRIGTAMLFEKTNRTQNFHRHIMELATRRKWYDEQGNIVGMVDHQGNPIQDPITQRLNRIGKLIHEDDPIVIHESTQEELRGACLNASPAFFESFKSVIDPVETAFSELKERITNSERAPDYLFQFNKGGILREDLTKILSLMESSKKIAEEDFKKSGWFLENRSALHLPTNDELSSAMSMIAGRQRLVSGWERLPTEYQARFELQEKLRAEILVLAGKKIEPMKVAKRIPALMAGHLDLLTHGIATQSRDLFGDPNCELGQTDAESMCYTLDLVSRCLLAYADIRRTKQVIPILE